MLLKVFNKFNIKNLGECHDLYVQSDTILLADVFESFRNLCLNTYKLIRYNLFFIITRTCMASLFKIFRNKIRTYK